MRQRSIASSRPRRLARDGSQALTKRPRRWLSSLGLPVTRLWRTFGVLLVTTVVASSAGRLSGYRCSSAGRLSGYRCSSAGRLSGYRCSSAGRLSGGRALTVVVSKLALRQHAAALWRNTDWVRRHVGSRRPIADDVMRLRPAGLGEQGSREIAHDSDDGVEQAPKAAGLRRRLLLAFTF